MFLFLFIPIISLAQPQVIVNVKMSESYQGYIEPPPAFTDDDYYDWIDNGDVDASPCPDRTYSNDTSGICKPCSTCRLGTFERYMCEPWQDTGCLQCDVCGPFDIIKCECNVILGECWSGDRVCIKTIPVTLMAGIPFMLGGDLTPEQTTWAESRLSTYMVSWIKSTFVHDQVEYISLVHVGSSYYVANYILYNVQNQTTKNTFMYGNPTLFNQGLNYAFTATRRRLLLAAAAAATGTVNATIHNRELLQYSQLSPPPLTNRSAVIAWFEQQALIWFQQHQGTLIIGGKHRLLLQFNPFNVIGVTNATPPSSCVPSGNTTCNPILEDDVCGVCYPKPCPPGYAPIGLRFECTECPVNTYKNTTGNASCTPCPPFSMSRPRSISIDQCIICPQGTTWSQADGCLPCPENTYKDLYGDQSCITCPNNGMSLANSVSLANCTYCPLGQYWDTNLKTCSFCGYDTYKDTIGNTQCLPCTPLGSSFSQRGSTSINQCLKCPPGQYISNHACATCPENTYKVGDSGGCIPCPSNTISLSGSVSIENCSGCPMGKYLLGSEQNCKLCPQNTYKSIIGNLLSMCLPCPFGGQSLNGSISQFNCSVCAPGMYQKNIGEPCIYCPESTFKTSLGNSMDLCTSCPDFLNSPLGSIAPSNCSGCIPGAQPKQTGGSGCSLCPEYTYDNSSRVCNSCPLFGQNMNSTGATSCQFLCPIGYGVRINDQDLTKKWMRGFSASGQPWFDVWDRSLRLLPGSTLDSFVFDPSQGKYVLAHGVDLVPTIAIALAPTQLQCAQCPLGTVSTTYPDNNISFCKDCPVNSITTETNRSVCQPCPPGQRGNLYYGGSTMCVFCEINTYSPSNDVGCLPCPAGTYTSSIGATKCLNLTTSSSTTPKFTSTSSSTTTTPIPTTSSTTPIPTTTEFSSPYKIMLSIMYDGVINDANDGIMIQAIAALLGVPTMHVKKVAGPLPLRRRQLLVAQEIQFVIFYLNTSTLITDAAKLNLPALNTIFATYGLVPITSITDVTILGIVIVPTPPPEPSSYDNMILTLVIGISCTATVLVLGGFVMYCTMKRHPKPKAVPEKLITPSQQKITHDGTIKINIPATPTKPTKKS